MTDNKLLEVEHLTMRFGGLVAIDNLSFTARKREITARTGRVRPQCLTVLRGSMCRPRAG